MRNQEGLLKAKSNILEDINEINEYET